MIATIIISLLIIGYLAYLSYKKIKNKGTSCCGTSCHCEAFPKKSSKS